MFKRKQKSVEKTIEFQVNVVNAEAINIKKTGTYILQIDHYMPTHSLNDMIKTLKKETGAKWIIVQGSGVKVVTNV
jgi:ribosomal protein S16